MTNGDMLVTGAGGAKGIIIMATDYSNGNQVAFTIFVLLETWLVPLEGYLIDKYGPRLITLLGGLLCGVSWVMNTFAGSLAELYTAAAIGGIGAGARRTDGDWIWRRLCAHHYPHR